jgi:hypothetical protein
MTTQQRAGERRARHHSPVWRSWRGLLFVVAGQLLARAGQLSRSQTARRSAYLVLLLVGLVGQGLLLLTAAYLIDLSVSLMELWAELARKHLEITL